MSDEKGTEEDEIRKVGEGISPMYHITADDPPALFVHGTADRIVPLQQAQIAVEKLKRVGVEAELSRRAKITHRFSISSSRHLRPFLNRESST